MRRRLVAAQCSLAGAVLLVGMGSGTAEAEQSGAFAGSWSSIDTDGSNQVLRVTGSGRGSYGMAWYDDARPIAPAHEGHGQSIDQRGSTAEDLHLEVDAMHTHQIMTPRRPLLAAPMARHAGDYDRATLDALRTFLADLAWSDQGE
jgi:hypothetical protein